MTEQSSHSLHPDRRLDLPSSEFSTPSGSLFLRNAGFDIASSCLKGAEIDPFLYQETVRGILIRPDRPGYIGDYLIPDEFRDSVEQARRDNVRIIAVSTPNGYGHDRMMGILKMLGTITGLEVDCVSFGSTDPRLKGSGFLQMWFEANHRTYIYKSLAEAKRTGMFDGNIDELIGRERNIVDLGYSVFARLYPQAYIKMALGDSSGLTLSGVDRQSKWLRRVFSRGLKEFLRRGNYSGVMALHPMMAQFIGNIPQVSVATDSGDLYPLWVNHTGPLFVESQTAADSLTRFYGRSADDLQIVVTGGFPAGPVSFIRDTLRREKAASDLTPVIIIPASGVSPVQLKIILGNIEALADQVNSGQIRLVIQAGHGREGRYTYQKIIEKLGQLKSKYTNIDQGTLVHWAAYESEALSFVDSLMWGRAKSIIMVKGSEMLRMAVNLHIPVILTGALGAHEFSNIYLAVMQGAPVYFTRDVYEQVLSGLRGLVDEGRLNRFISKVTSDGLIVPSTARAVELGVGWYNQEDRVVGADPAGAQVQIYKSLLHQVLSSSS